MIVTAGLAIARRLPWRYIGPALAVAGLLAALLWWHGGRVDATFKAGADSRNGEVALLIRERDTARANVANLQLAIAQRTAAIDLAAGKTKAAQDKAAAAAERADARGKALAATRAQLADAARAAPSGPGCAVTPLARDVWRKL